MANAGKTPPTGPLSGRERRTAMRAAAVIGVVIIVAALVVVVVDRLSGPPPAGERCITVSIASSMGGAVERACGAAARNSCQAVYQKQDVHSLAVQQACRSAGIGP
ncbi:MAG: hypothetical protein WCE30_23980 [Mycobacterium sp.]